MAGKLKFCSFCGEKMVEKELVREPGTESSFNSETGRPYKDIYLICPNYTGNRNAHTYRWLRTDQA